MASIKNAMIYFPGHQGKINNIITACGNLGGALFNFLMGYIINKEGINPSIEKVYFSYEVAVKYKNYLYMHIGAIMGVSLISIVLIWFPIKESSELIEIMEPSIGSEEKVNNILPEDVVSSPEEPTKESQCQMKLSVSIGSVDEFKTPNIVDPKAMYKTNVKAAIFSCRIVLLFSIFLLTTFETNIITTTFFSFGLQNNIEIGHLKTGIVIMSLASSVFGPCWGFFYDCLGFRRIIITINIISAANGTLFFFFRNYTIAYITFGVINNILTGGVFGLVFTQIMKIFTHKYATEIYGVVVFSTGISGMLASVYTYLINNVFKVDFYYAYLTVYLIGAGFNVLAIVVSLFETSNKFEYPLDTQVNQEE